MIALLSVSAVTLAALQASINAPTEAFRGCLKEASAKATSEKVPADSIDAYLRNACSGKLSALESAVISFRVKNGMNRKSAAADAAMTIDDYVGTSVDKYQFMATLNAPAKKAPDATPQPTPAAAPQPQQ